jgi:hypothetical protein
MALLGMVARGKLKIFSDFIGTRSRDHPACSVPRNLPRYCVPPAYV